MVKINASHHEHRQQTNSESHISCVAPHQQLSPQFPVLHCTFHTLCPKIYDFPTQLHLSTAFVFYFFLLSHICLLLPFFICLISPIRFLHYASFPNQTQAIINVRLVDETCGQAELWGQKIGKQPWTNYRTQEFEAQHLRINFYLEKNSGHESVKAKITICGPSDSLNLVATCSA